MLSEYTSQSTVNIIIHALLSSIKSAVKMIFSLPTHHSHTFFSSVICVQRGEREREREKSWKNEAITQMLAAWWCSNVRVRRGVREWQCVCWECMDRMVNKQPVWQTHTHTQRHRWLGYSPPERALKASAGGPQ